jgi:hypothetical protein
MGWACVPDFLMVNPPKYVPLFKEMVVPGVAAVIAETSCAWVETVVIAL